MSTTKEAKVEVETAEEDAKLSFSDTIGSLTGFEETTIEERFGEPIGQLMAKALSKAGRALIFIVEIRNGAKTADAYKKSMGMRLVDVNSRFFEEDDEDEDDEDPETPEGKGDSPSD